MIKKHIIIILLLLSLSGCQLIEAQLEIEEAERRRQIENNEVIMGRDTMFIWNKHYAIYHGIYGESLSVTMENLSDTILERVLDYKVYNDKFYVISEEGFAVMDRNNYCRVLITLPEEEFVSTQTLDDGTTKTYPRNYVESEHIKYLKKFDDFSEKERTNFKKISKK